MRLDDVLDDREPEAEPSFAAPRRRVALAKTVEDVWQEHRVDALARVTNDDSPDVCVASDAHDDVPAGGGELEGVGHQISDDLLQTLGITQHGDAAAHVADQMHLRRLGARPVRFDDVLGHRGQVDAPRGDLQLARGRT